MRSVRTRDLVFLLRAKGKFWLRLQHGWILTLMLSEIRQSQKGQNTVWLHLYLVARIAETESRVELARGGGKEGRGAVFSGCSFTFAGWKVFWRWVVQPCECTKHYGKLYDMWSFLKLQLKKKNLKWGWMGNSWSGSRSEHSSELGSTVAWGQDGCRLWECVGWHRWPAEARPDGDRSAAGG